MKVVLRNNWFGPDATLYYKDEGGTEIPDQFKDLLPSTAKVVEDDYKPPRTQKKAEPSTLSEMAKKSASGPLDKK